METPRRVVDVICMDQQQSAIDEEYEGDEEDVVTSTPETMMINMFDNCDEETDTDHDMQDSDVSIEDDIYCIQPESATTNSSNDWRNDDMEPLENSNPSLFESLDYRLKCYVLFAASEGISNEGLKRLDSLMTVLYGNEPLFNHYDVLNVIKRTEKKVIQETAFYCNRCGIEKSSKWVECIPCKKPETNLLETISYIRCSVKFQLEQLLIEHGREIISSHFKIHTGNVPFEANDIRRHKGYRNGIESKKKFDETEINLLCTYSSDGARFKRISRREVTPAFLKVEGFDVKTKAAGKALCLLFLAFSDGGLKKNTIDIIVRRSFENLIGTKVTVKIDGISYTFSLAVMSVTCDMKEQQLLTSLPNWHQPQGCALCYTTGRKKPDGKISYDDHYPSPKRTDQEMQHDSKNSYHGYTSDSAPPLYQYVLPTIVTCDPFHIRGAGICKQIVNEFLKPRKWNNGKLKPGHMNTIIASIESIVGYTNDYVKVQSFKKLSKATGREYDKLSVLVSALIGTQGSCLCNDFNALYTGWFFCLQFLGTVLASPGNLRILLNLCYQLHVNLEPDTLTIKWHTFYEHLLDHEELYGHLHTTEVFEREHKSLMTAVHHQATNCEKTIISRYCTAKIMGTSLPRSLSQYSASTMSTAMEVMRTRNKKLTDQKRSFAFGMDGLIPEHRNLASEMSLPASTLFLKRMEVTSMLGSFAISSCRYWKTSNTTSSLVTYSDPSNGGYCFGEVEIIFDSSSACFLVCRQFILEPLVITFKNWSMHSLSPLGTNVLDCCMAFPTVFGKILSERYSLVPMSAVVAPAIIISIRNSRFVKISI